MRINVKVRPLSGRQDIIKLDEKHFMIYLKSAPEDNKANSELIKLLHKYFKKEVVIKSGLTSKNKIVEIKEN